MKSSDWSIEKLLRSYDCDVSRLLTALKAVRADKDIKIVRIKNMLDEKFDSWRTGGFRYTHAAFSAE